MIVCSPNSQPSSETRQAEDVAAEQRQERIHRPVQHELRGLRGARDQDQRSRTISRRRAGILPWRAEETVVVELAAPAG